MAVRIYRDVYKGINCIVMENERLRVCFVSTGSRMVSFIDKASGRELLYQGKNKEYITGCYDGSFPGIDLGFDEMFPSIDECYYEDYPWKGIKIPDHGEVWSLEWDYDIHDDSLEMGVHGIRFPYRFEKRISFSQDNILRIDYRACNLSPFDLNFLWAAHPMMSVEENSRVILPPECRTGVSVHDGSGRLGSFGTLFDVAEKTGYIDTEGGNIVHKIRDKSLKCIEKYYIQGRLKNGRCGIQYPSDGTAVMLNFPVNTVPYLGVLVADGGIIESGCTAILEPCTATYDRIDFARAFTGGSVLKAKSSYEWYLEFELMNIP